MRETREILINWDGNIEAFKEAFNVQVVPIPEMVDNTYMVIYECYTEEIDGEIITHDFKDDRQYLKANGVLKVLGKWNTKGKKKRDGVTENDHTKAKYRRHLRKVWDEDKQRFVRPPANTPVNCVSGWNSRNID